MAHGTQYARHRRCSVARIYIGARCGPRCGRGKRALEDVCGVGSVFASCACDNLAGLDEMNRCTCPLAAGAWCGVARRWCRPCSASYWAAAAPRPVGCVYVAIGWQRKGKSSLALERSLDSLSAWCHCAWRSCRCHTAARSTEARLAHAHAVVQHTRCRDQNVLRILPPDGPFNCTPTPLHYTTCTAVPRRVGVAHSRHAFGGK